QPSPVGRDARIELPRPGVDRARQRPRLPPHAVAALRNVQIIRADGIGAPRRAEEKIALVGSDPRLDLSSGRVDRVAEVLGWLVRTLHEPRPPDILVAPSTGWAVAAEIQIAVRGNGRRPLVASLVVHRTIEMVRLSP